MKSYILGVKVDDVNMDQALSQIEKWIWNPGKHYIVTPNPEFIVAAQKDLIFKKVLNDADLSIPDGVGLKLSGRVKNTFAGTDLMERLISLAAEKGFVTGFLGGKEGVAKKVVERLKRKYPNLKISYVSSGGVIDNDGNPQEVLSSKYYVSREEVDKSKNSHNTKYITPATDILFVAFGHIKQEKWIANNLGKIPVKIAVGVGGAFDYLSGSIPRAPIWLRSLGFEWLFRLTVQPTRIKRQLALLQYLWLLLVRGNEP